MKRALLVLLVLSGCTAAPPRATVVTPTPSPAPARTPTVAPVVFDAGRALADGRAIAAVGPRGTTDASYRRAADLVASRLRALGYRVRTIPFTVQGGYTIVPGRHVPVAAGSTYDVVAEPPHFDMRKPFVLAGGHLDTVPGAPGANDNASGVAVMLELARMARLDPPQLPVVFVAFAAEERRHQTASQSEYAQGSAAYVHALPVYARLRAMLDLDMVGAGSRVELLGTPSLVTRAAGIAATARIPAHRNTTFFLSDHLPFIQAGYPVLWLWAGDNPTLHTPRDTFAIVQRAELARAGTLAWLFLHPLH
ncbi:MAG: M28 family metallopeptidase [Actinomycetota bacterium]